VQETNLHTPWQTFVRRVVTSFVSSTDCSKRSLLNSSVPRRVHLISEIQLGMIILTGLKSAPNSSNTPMSKITRQVRPENIISCATKSLAVVGAERTRRQPILSRSPAYNRPAQHLRRSDRPHSQEYRKGEQNLCEIGKVMLIPGLQIRAPRGNNSVALY
jgi:hypothetical protein